ncbi:MAG: M23 family metallopeptidase [Myxococcales bacterium]|nr:M23 family metallopeptidase [Myxococcales bacterium]
MRTKTVVFLICGLAAAVLTVFIATNVQDNNREVVRRQPAAATNTARDLDLSSAVVVDLPFVGEWVAVNTPAKQVPSHGTNYFGQRFAYDFARLNDSGQSFSKQDNWKQIVGAVPAEDFLAWNQPILAAFPGEVIAVGEGWPDQIKINVLWEMARGKLFQRRPAGRDYRPLTGNYILIAGTPGVALYAHLRRGSIRVRTGSRVETGQPLGSLGNSGNSSMPHLHFHVMDNPDPLTARGVLCAFHAYERRVGDDWQSVEIGVPGPMERFRTGQSDN